uniref:Leucine rich repeats and calponin homology domain containing 4 n=1 Tax=Coturnix japonica TaxID=93934 RepID=A0A8C2SRR2_COTJA
MTALRQLVGETPPPNKEQPPPQMRGLPLNKRLPPSGWDIPPKWGCPPSLWDTLIPPHWTPPLPIPSLHIGTPPHLVPPPHQDVSCNELRSLPPSIGRLSSLRDLNVRRNRITALPAELSLLPLVRLDFSCNHVTSIPRCFRRLRHLQALLCDNNPLHSPPPQRPTGAQHLPAAGKQFIWIITANYSSLHPLEEGVCINVCNSPIPQTPGVLHPAALSAHHGEHWGTWGQGVTKGSFWGGECMVCDPPLVFLPKHRAPTPPSSPQTQQFPVPGEQR